MTRFLLKIIAGCDELMLNPMFENPTPNFHEMGHNLEAVIRVPSTVLETELGR